MLDARSNIPVIMAKGPKKIKHNRFILRPFFIFSLTITFLFNSLGGALFVGDLWAAKVSPGLTSVGPDKDGSPTPLKNLSAETFSLPRELGYIQEKSNIPGATKTVVHIQDAHCNYDAQKQIAQILGYLATEYGASAVNCEGGAEDYDLSPFTVIPEKDIREKTSDYFVKEGVVNAAEYFAVNNPEKVKLWGVEDPDLYIKNLKIYRDSLGHKGEVDKYIKSISYILDNLKKHVYSQDLLEFDTYYTKYKDNKIGFKEYLTYLVMAGKKRMIDIKTFPNVYLLNQTLEQEDGINFKKANNEKDEVVKKLEKVLSRNELRELTAKVTELKIERISQAEFYAYLVKKAKSIKVDLTAYFELQKYVIYISLYSAVDRTKITTELDALEDKIKETMYENDTQRELGILSKNMTLTNNMFNISLTRDDYTYYVEHKPIFSVSNYIKFIDREAPLYKIQAVLNPDINMLDVYRESMEKFYECSLERDKAFVKNIKFTDHTRPNSIIITGGFHTQNLRELFKKEKVSYISIMPNFKNPPGYESPYMKRLAGQRTALENVIDTAIPAVLNLQVPNFLNPKIQKLVEELVGGISSSDRKKLEAAIEAEINRGKAFILEIRRKDEEKFITFTKGEGAEPIDYVTQSASQVSSEVKNAVNAEFTEKGLNIFTTQAPVVPTSSSASVQPPGQRTTEEGVPIIKPFARVNNGKIELIPQTAQVGPVDNIINSKPDRVEMIRLVGERIYKLVGEDKSKGPEIIWSVLVSISGLEPSIQNDIIMATRTAVAIKGLTEIRPRGLNVVVQVAPTGQRNSAENADKRVSDKLDRYYNALQAKSIIGEGIKAGDVDGLAALIGRARDSMGVSGEARTLLLLPAYLQDKDNTVPKAMEKAGVAGDSRIKIQFVDQGEMPDLLSQFMFGIEILEYVRDGENPDKVSQRLLDLIAAMIAGEVNPLDIIKNELFKGVLKIRPVNWKGLEEQRRSWEAVVQSV